eukprot:3388485-Rhodomonas_salina.2
MFFPLRKHDQRVYGNYDEHTVREMRAANQHVTLDLQAPSLAQSDLWDQQLASMSLEHANAPSAEVTADGGSSDSARDPPTPHPEARVFDETEHPGQVCSSSLTSGTATSILRLNKRRSAVGGRRLKQRKVNEAAEPPGEDENAVAWDDCADTPID